MPPCFEIVAFRVTESQSNSDWKMFSADTFVRSTNMGTPWAQSQKDALEHGMHGVQQMFWDVHSGCVPQAFLDMGSSSGPSRAPQLLVVSMSSDQEIKAMPWLPKHGTTEANCSQLPKFENMLSTPTCFLALLVWHLISMLLPWNKKSERMQPRSCWCIPISAAVRRRHTPNESL